jgi:hypothetical protein
LPLTAVSINERCTIDLNVLFALDFQCAVIAAQINAEPS